MVVFIRIKLLTLWQPFHVLIVAKLHPIEVETFHYTYTQYKGFPKPEYILNCIFKNWMKYTLYNYENKKKASVFGIKTIDQHFGAN